MRQIIPASFRYAGSVHYVTVSALSPNHANCAEGAVRRRRGRAAAFIMSDRIS